MRYLVGVWIRFDYGPYLRTNYSSFFLFRYSFGCTLRLGSYLCFCLWRELFSVVVYPFLRRVVLRGPDLVDWLYHKQACGRFVSKLASSRCQSLERLGIGSDRRVLGVEYTVGARWACKAYGRRLIGGYLRDCLDLGEIWWKSRLLSWLLFLVKVKVKLT